MTATEPVGLANPTQLVHRRTPAVAMQYDGSEERRDEIAEWVIAAGGSAESRFDGLLLVLTPITWAIVPAAWWVVQGVVGQFFVIEPDVRTRCYDLAGPNFNAMLTREQAAAIVVSIDEMVTAVRQSGNRNPELEQAAGWIHQLASTAEALR